MKRRSFLGALAGILAAPKLLEAKSEPSLADMLRIPAMSEDEWVATYTENPAKEPVTICPNCGRFRTKKIVMALAPEAGVAALSDYDYLPSPSSLTYIEGCPRCAEEMRDARL